MNTPLSQKQKFLQRKGLTDTEIQIACDKSGAYNKHEVQSHVQSPTVGPLNPYNPYNQVQYSFFHKIREIVHNIAIFSVVAYVIHKFYQVS